MQKKNKGFTLLELMIVLAIAGILMTAAFPSFQDMIARNRMATQVNDLLLAINLARSEALRIGSVASVQAVDGSDSDNEFGAGWCVVLGNPGDCTTSLRTFDAVDFGTMNSVEDVTSIQFSSLGGLSGTGGATRSFDLCRSGMEGRRIVIAVIGRSKSHRSDDPVTAFQPGC